MLRIASLFLLVFLSGVVLSRAQDFQYSVQHHHTLRDCRGVLKINTEGVSFTAAKGKDSRRWTFESIRVLEVQSASKISIRSYEDQKRWLGKDKVFEFRLVDKNLTPELSAFLLTRVKRPMKIAVIPDIPGSPAFELPVKHLHPISGTQGVLQIYTDKVVYKTQASGDSRYWRIQDIERFSQPDRFRFQIISYVPKAGGPNESYDFQLMEDLPEGVYDFLWVRLHPSSYYPEIR
jgi:hypothetical protein